MGNACTIAHTCVSRAKIKKLRKKVKKNVDESVLVGIMQQESDGRGRDR